MVQQLPRRRYEKELVKLQGDLAAMTEWIHRSGARVVVLFEGRDAAGKGGVIKRITEYLNPRSCRVAALPAPTEREKGAVVLPALRGPAAAAGEIVALRPQLVQPGRRRAGDGVLHRRGVPAVLPPVPGIRAHAHRGRDHPGEVLVLGQRRGAGAPVPEPARRPAAALEAEPDGPRGPPALGGLLAGQGRHVRSTPTRPSRPGGWWRPTTSGGRGSTASPTCWARCPTGWSTKAGSTCPKRARTRLPAAAPGPVHLRPRLRRHPDRYRPAWPGGPAAASAGHATPDGPGQQAHQGEDPAEHRRGVDHRTPSRSPAPPRRPPPRAWSRTGLGPSPRSSARPRTPAHDHHAHAGAGQGVPRPWEKASSPAFDDP